MKKNLFFCSLLFFSFTSYCQNWQWALRAGGTDQSFSEEDFISGIKNDVQGNIFALGSFTQNADFGPFTLAGNANYSQLFLAKLNPAGVFQWVVSTTGPGRVFAENIEIDDSSNIYVTGQFQADTIYLQGDTLIPMNIQDPQVLIAKFDLNGNKIWTRTFQSLRSNERCLIKPSSNNQLFFCYLEGNIYPLLADLKVGTLNIVDGTIISLQDIAQFRGNLGGMTVNKDYKTLIQVLFNDTLYSATDTFVGENGQCILLCVDSTFNKVFSKQIPVTSSLTGLSSLILDNNDNIYSVGSFVDTLIVNNDTLYNPPSNFADNSYLLSLDKEGNYRWVKHFNSSFDNYISAITADTSGNFYTTGYFGANITIDNITAFGFQNDDIFVTKCDSVGNFSWIKTAGGTDDDIPIALSVSQNGKIYIGGYFKNNCTIGNTSFLSNGNTDAFLAKLSNPIISGLQESLNNPNQLSVYPNPNNGEFLFALPVDINNQYCQLKISDCIGNIIYEKDILNANKTRSLNIPQLHNGLLFLEITNTRGQHFITKFIKL